MLRTRIVTAVVLLSGLLAALFYLPTLVWAGFCALICALAAWEWGGLAGWSRNARIVYGFVLGCLCFVPVFLMLVVLREARLGTTEGAVFVFLLLFLLALFLLAGFFWLLVVPLWLCRKWPLRGWATALVGIIVLVPATLIFIALRESDDVPLALLIVCALAWVADIAAYFSGRMFGGKKLAPNISPGKTWAGAIGAVIGVLVYCNVVLFVAGSGENNMSFVTAIENPLLLQLVFIGLAVWSIIGDLFESLLKRQAGVKDSSNLLPGHGGILDRVDSLVSTLTLLGFIIALKIVFS
ncbi:MAG: phosphatidate cytidylyltransferase [Betaproteobacteria bacterium]|nr:phosphatidate cytidylyltransferase [Betaproteobacteria bacterium]